MAVTCARCGAQNPDGNSYCQSCGTPLTAAAVSAAVAPRPQYAPPPPGPPVAYASPPGYQSPYYSPGPAAMQPPVHRTPWTLIIAVIVAVVIVMVGAGTAIALIGSHSSGTGSNTFSSQLPTPSPAGTPTPIGSPTPIASGTASSDNNTLTMPLPSGWSVSNHDSESVEIVNPNGDGAVLAASGSAGQGLTPQDEKDAIDKSLASKSPDAKACPNTRTTSGALNGAPGLFWIECFTITSGNQSFPAAAALFAGANSDGSVYYQFGEITSQSNLNSFIAQAKPVLQGVVWKLT